MGELKDEEEEEETGGGHHRAGPVRPSLLRDGGSLAAAYRVRRRR